MHTHNKVALNIIRLVWRLQVFTPLWASIIYATVQQKISKRLIFGNFEYYKNFRQYKSKCLIFGGVIHWFNQLQVFKNINQRSFVLKN